MLIFLASCKWRDAQCAIRNFSPLQIYRLYTIGAYLDVRASLFTFAGRIYACTFVQRYTVTALQMFGNQYSNTQSRQRSKDDLSQQFHLILLLSITLLFLVNASVQWTCTVIYHVYTKINFPEPSHMKINFPAEPTPKINYLSKQNLTAPPLPSQNQMVVSLHCVPQAPKYNR